MKNMRTMKSIRVTERMKAVMQVVAVALVLLWCGFGMMRAILQRVDAIVVIGFGVGTWAAWMLLRMSIAEMREAQKEETDGE